MVRREGSINSLQQEPRPKYYVIRMDGQGKAPTVTHRTRAAAHRAAEALAWSYPGVQFAVVKLKTMLSVKLNEAEASIAA